MQNCLSIDIETWAYADTPEFRAMSSSERKAADNGYLPDSVKRVLALLREFNQKITLFMVGEQYAWYPELPDLILADGHELGLHAFRHYLIKDRDALRKDLEQAAPFVEKYHIKGYRAPLIHLPDGGYEILAEFGFTFDSSIYGPFSMAGKHKGVEIVPISSYKLGNTKPELRLPRHLSFSNMIGGGEFFYGASYFVGLLGRQVRHFISLTNRRGDPSVVFLHNWQIFPPANASFPPSGYLLSHPMYWPLTRNLEKSMRSLLKEFTFAKMSSFCRM